MNNWFTIEKLDSDTYRLCEDKYSGSPCCWLLLGAERALLIDSGTGIADIGVVVRSLTSLPVTVTLTHASFERIGGLGCFDDTCVSGEERAWVEGKQPFTIDDIRAEMAQSLCEPPDSFDIDSYVPYSGGAANIIEGGHIFDLGGRTVEVISTPGHTPGHMCYYDRERRYLYSGDLIHSEHLSIFGSPSAPVDYMRSIKQILRMDIERFFAANAGDAPSFELLGRIDNAFSAIYREGKLRSGSGRFEIDGIKIEM